MCGIAAIFFSIHLQRLLEPGNSVSSTKGWLSSQVVSMLDSATMLLGNSLTPIVPLFTKQRNWQQPS